MIRNIILSTNDNFVPYILHSYNEYHDVFILYPCLPFFKIYFPDVSFLALPERDPKVFITFKFYVNFTHLYISCTAQHKNNEEENSQEDEEPDRGGEQPGDACHGGKGGRLFGNPAVMVVIPVRRALNNLCSF